jgi:NodT family efflux transporter outer membrane factor (OMF) lipoprotein
MNRSNLILATAIVSSALLAAGCMVGPDYHSSKDQPSEGWTSLTNPAPTTNLTTQPTTQRYSTVDPASPAQTAQWWQSFGEEELNSLIERGIANNLDVRQAEARIRQARASRGVVASALYPTIDTSGSYSRSGTGRADDVANGDARHDLYQAGIDATWEIDIFGGVRRDVEAANADIVAAVEDRRDVLVTLTSEIALAYLDLRSFQTQLALAQKNLSTQQYTADLTRRRKAGGFVSALDVANAEAQVATTTSLIPSLTQSARQAMYSIAVLLGEEPGTLVDELANESPIPQVPDSIPIGLPSELLRRRPDIRRAEAQVHAATARIGVATAELFPRFSLTGSLAVSGSKPANLANWNNSFWSFGPSVSWPLFSAGRIRANIAVQNAVQEQTLLTYRATVLTALQDVENALVAYSQEQTRRVALAQAVDANRRAVDLSSLLYQQGQIDFLNVLNAQRALFASEDALAQSERTVAQNLVALYKGLGGGWDEVDANRDQQTTR